MAKQKHPFDAVVELVDKTLGTTDELSADEVNSFLADAKCDTARLKRRLYYRATELRGVYWERNANEPAHLKDFIQQLRPADIGTSDPEQERASAQKWFTQLFERVPVITESSIAYSFHRRSETVSPQDEASLRELADQLRKKLDDKGGR